MLPPLVHLGRSMQSNSIKVGQTLSTEEDELKDSVTNKLGAVYLYLSLSKDLEYLHILSFENKEVFLIISIS